MVVTLLLLTGLLALANGANDSGKGVATLAAYGAATPGRALAFATAATALGGLTSFWLAGGLIQGFTGGGLFAAGVAFDNRFYVSVLIGACAWVLLATRTGLPVSTTHAIVGALCGAGLVAFGDARLRWGALGMKFALPLALSPALSLALVLAVAGPILFATRSLAGRCLCLLERRTVAAAAQGFAVIHGRETSPLLTLSDEQGCAESPGLRGSTLTTGTHWLACGLISFARGWNDTPKIAALSLFGLAGAPHGAAAGFAIVAVAMALGGLLAGRRVLDTLASKLTPLPLAHSIAASTVTAVLVGLASWKEMPVSTTHVATGSIVGAGLANDRSAVKWNKVAEIVISWVVTLPVAAVVAAGVEAFLR